MDEYTELRQMQQNEEMRHVQEQRLFLPHFPWPTSKPGPYATQPPPGERPMPGRTDQMVEIAYDQETGVPATADLRKWFPDEARAGATGFDQLETAQEVTRKRKKRK
ncbi:MAG TPA: hypothetical protein VEU97_16570 [Ktedonobacteraceae bacterium]|nr:hypothetical protein [Ktedonobacteraceae bacterium]